MHKRALVYFAAVATETAEEDCLEELHQVCGTPPYGSAQACTRCAEHTFAALKAHQCTLPVVVQECNKTSGGGNIPAPDGVSNMSLHLVSSADGKTVQVTMTGPPHVWFAVAYNEQNPTMNGSSAFVYSNNGTHPQVDLRLLGMHAPGSIIVADYPATVLSGATSVSVSFEIPNSGISWAAAIERANKVAATRAGSDPQAAPGYCWLFAHGTDMDYAYHGAARGATCTN